MFTFRTTLACQQRQILSAPHQGERQKAARGELRLPVPAGLVHDRSGAVMLNLDEEVRARLALVFVKFRELGSARAVMRYLRRKDLPLPVRPLVGPAPHDVVWRKADSARVLRILQNPAYAGAYVYGRRRAEGGRIRDGEYRAKTTKVPMADWDVCLQAAHPGYISWEEFMDLATQPLLIEDDLADDEAQNGLAIRRRRRRGTPDAGKIFAHPLQRMAIRLGQDEGLVTAPALVILFDRVGGTQLLFPDALKGSRHQPVLRFDSIILPARPIRLVTGALAPQRPLALELAHFLRDLAHRSDRDGDLVRRQGVEQHHSAEHPLMRTTQALSITLPHDMAQMVKDKVASGEYASESEVIRDGLRTLAARDAMVEKWLREEVAPTYDRVMADPEGETIPAEEVFAGIRARHARRRPAREAIPRYLFQAGTLPV